MKVGNQARRLTIDIVKLESLLYKSKGEGSSHGKFFSFTCFAFWCWRPPLTVPTSYWCGTTKSDLVIGCWAAVYSSCTVIVKYRCCRGTTWFLSTSETVWARFATHVLAELIFTCTILLSAVSIRRRAVIVQWTVCKMNRNTDSELCINEIQKVNCASMKYASWGDWAIIGTIQYYLSDINQFSLASTMMWEWFLTLTSFIN